MKWSPIQTVATTGCIWTYPYHLGNNLYGWIVSHARVEEGHAVELVGGSDDVCERFECFGVGEGDGLEGRPVFLINDVEEEG